jgi:hypothetical protein
VDADDVHVDSAHLRRLQRRENLRRHTPRELDETVVFADVDVTDVAAIQACLVCNCTDDVSGASPVHMANVDAKYLALLMSVTSASGLSLPGCSRALCRLALLL